jgi:CheY-like chemotaxis protein
VEDEPLTRMNVVEAIEGAGIPTHEAADAAEALQAVRDCPDIRLLFTDITLPGEMDGLELASKVCAQDPNLGLIVTSGALEMDHELPCGGTFLPKPYTAIRLLGLIEEKLPKPRTF